MVRERPRQDSNDGQDRDVNFGLQEPGEKSSLSE
jgi:hypothetical protein